MGYKLGPPVDYDPFSGAGTAPETTGKFRLGPPVDFDPFAEKKPEQRGLLSEMYEAGKSGLETGLRSAPAALAGATGAVSPETVADVLTQPTFGTGKYEFPQETKDFFTDIDAGEYWNAAKKLVGSPARIMGPIAAQGLGTSAIPIVGGMAGSLAGPLGMAGGVGAGSLVVDAGATTLEFLSEKGVDLKDRASIIRAFSDQNLMAEARTEAVKHGVPVAAFDAFSAGIAGRLVSGAKTVGQGIRRATGEVGMQAGFGGLGEATGEIVQKGEVYSPSSVVAEMIGEVPSGAIEIARGAMFRKKTDDKPPPKAGENPLPPAEPPGVPPAGQEAAAAQAVPAIRKVIATLGDQLVMADVIAEGQGVGKNLVSLRLYDGTFQTVDTNKVKLEPVVEPEQPAAEAEKPAAPPGPPQMPPGAPPAAPPPAAVPRPKPTPAAQPQPEAEPPSVETPVPIQNVVAAGLPKPGTEVSVTYEGEDAPYGTTTVAGYADTPDGRKVIFAKPLGAGKIKHMFLDTGTIEPVRPAPAAPGGQQQPQPAVVAPSTAAPKPVQPPAAVASPPVVPAPGPSGAPVTAAKPIVKRGKKPILETPVEGAALLSSPVPEVSGAASGAGAGPVDFTLPTVQPPAAEPVKPATAPPPASPSEKTAPSEPAPATAPADDEMVAERDLTDIPDFLRRRVEAEKTAAVVEPTKTSYVMPDPEVRKAASEKRIAEMKVAKASGVKKPAAIKTGTKITGEMTPEEANELRRTKGKDETPRGMFQKLDASAVGEVSQPDSAREQFFDYAGGELASVSPLEIVDAPVLGTLKNDKVRRAVIKSIPVDVVDILASEGFSAEQLVSEPDVVGKALPVNIRPAVARGLTRSLALVRTRLATALNRVLTSDATRGDEEILPAVRASDLDPDIVAGLLSSLGEADFSTPRGALSEENSSASNATEPTMPTRGRYLTGIAPKLSPTQIAKALDRHKEIVTQKNGQLQRKRIGKDTEAAVEDSTESERQRVYEGLRKTLDSILGPGADLDVVDKIFWEIDGVTGDALGHHLSSDGRSIITVAMESPASSMRHEIIHALRSMGLLDEKIWNALLKAAPTWRRRFDIDNRYKAEKLSEELLNEEAVAEAYAAWYRGELQVGSAIERIFQKIAEFFERIANWANDNGFISASDVFKAIERGDFMPSATRADMENMPMGTPSEAHQVARVAMRDRIKQVKDYAKNPLNTLRALSDPFILLPDKSAFLEARSETQGKIYTNEELVGDIGKFIGLKGESRDQAMRYFTTKGASPSMIADLKVRAAAVKAKTKINENADKLVLASKLPDEPYRKFQDAYLPRLYLAHLLDIPRWIIDGGVAARKSAEDYLKKRGDIPEDIRKILLGQIEDPFYLAARTISVVGRDMALDDFFNMIAENPSWVARSVVEWDGKRIETRKLLEMSRELRKQAAKMKGDEKKTALAKAKEMRSAALANQVVEWRGKRFTPQALKAESSNLLLRIPYMEEKYRLAATETAKEMAAIADNALAAQGKFPDDYKQLPDTPRYGRVRGLWVNDQIYDDLVGTFGMTDPNGSWFEKIFAPHGTLTKATRMWKFGKVVANPPSHFRNFFSNMINFTVSDVSNVMKIPALLADAASQMRNDGPVWKDAKRMGIGASGFSRSELYQVEKEFLALQASNGGLGRKGLKKAADAADWMSKIYQGNENLFKVAYMIDAIKNRKLSVAKAVEGANETFYDYSSLPRWAKAVRESPIGMPFLTYSLKTLPYMLNAAAKRPLRFLPYVAIAYGLPAFVAGQWDLDDDDLSRLKQTYYRWARDRGSVYLMPWKNASGQWDLWDASYVLPWGQFYEAFNKLTEGRPLEAARGLGLFGAPVSSIIAAASTNVDPFTQRPIYDKRDPAAKQWLDTAWYAWSLAMPTWLGDYGFPKKIINAANNVSSDRYGTPGTTMGEAIARVFGINLYGLDPEASRAQNISTMRRDLDDQKGRLTMTARDQRLSEETKKSRIEALELDIKRKADELKKYVDASQPTEKIKVGRKVTGE